ncbi:4-alpha-glucanotransferase [Rhizosphaericola mali]|uniref:4-alpha-glucanotransferase n=1 Tax=Rhizosphaericola mali TaxID=2545455 RepID=A0A5P2FWD8_9BACT|nr:4-alpha-glucanotransferase [Rhizosphaericola mali]QES87844.1 hypothetical protein E0W69_003895 [Rhizosphaericola mali]
MKKANVDSKTSSKASPIKKEVKPKKIEKVVAKKTVTKVVAVEKAPAKERIPKKASKPIDKVKPTYFLTFQLNYHTEDGESVWLTDVSGFTEDSAIQLMQFENSEYWKCTKEIQWDKIPESITYQYHIKKKDGSFLNDFKPKTVTNDKFTNTQIFIRDYWDYAGYFAHTFETAAFDVLLHKKNWNDVVPKSTTKATHFFQINAPILTENEAVGIWGDADNLGAWKEGGFLPMAYDQQEKLWKVAVNFPLETAHFHYKYIVYDTQTKQIKQVETGENRYSFNFSDISVVQNDGFLRFASDHWKGAGVNIPLFSIRSECDFGIGDFAGLEKFIFWSKNAGLKLVQLLPINDTTQLGGWKESYPYSAISVFALHPIYVDIISLFGKSAKNIAYLKKIEKERCRLNALEKLDYESVFRLKMDALQYIFPIKKKTTFASADFKQFYEVNKFWLKSYALFCTLRDQKQSVEFETWENASVYSDELFEKKYISDGTSIDFYVFIQYILHSQLSSVVEIAKQNGIVLKGDIAIGVDRHSVDVWQNPDLFDVEMQAGAPPDFFTKAGQNWGFPIYNWANMGKDDFQWWRGRLAHMSQYFQAIRLDHILGFFRIWSIPVANTQGLLGYFQPALGYSENELLQWGIHFDYERYCQPFISETILDVTFYEQKETIKAEFLDQKWDDLYRFKSHLDTQKKLVEYFKTKEVTDNSQWILTELLSLLANVILIQDIHLPQIYHCRFQLFETKSYEALSAYEKDKLYHLHNQYFYERQNQLWQKLGLEKLPLLKDASNMLVCGEDLGMVPSIVPSVMQNLGILGLRVERMSTQPERLFESPLSVSYLNVVMPSTHDTLPLRNWYTSLDALKKEQYYHQELRLSGTVPTQYSSILSEQIILMHLQSPAIWAIFLLQDLFGLESDLTNSNMEADIINRPEVPNFYWQYRMHLTIENLQKNSSFCQKIQNLLQFCAR